MKYIKSFKIFESNEEDIKSDVNDILIDLVDDKARINVDLFKGYFQGKDMLNVIIYFDNMYNDGVDVSKYKDNISHLLSYVGEDGLGFEFSSLFVDTNQDNFEIVCPECKSEDIEYGEEDWYNNGAIMNTCNVCGHRDTEEEFEFNKTKKDYDTIEEVKEFFSKPNGYEVNSVTFEFIKK
jgi:hypothetical protein